jgi:hypothetical protein
MCPAPSRKNVTFVYVSLLIKKILDLILIYGIKDMEKGGKRRTNKISAYSLCSDYRTGALGLVGFTSDI